MNYLRNSVLMIAILVVTAISFSACGGSDDSGEGEGEGEGEGNGDCSVQTSADDICAVNKTAFGDALLEGQANLPEGFPAAPDGVELCGTLGQGIGIQVIYAVTASEEEIVSYYSDALEAAGYTITSIDANSGECGQTINFTSTEDMGSIAYIGIHSEIIITLI